MRSAPRARRGVRALAAFSLRFETAFILVALLGVTVQSCHHELTPDVSAPQPGCRAVVPADPDVEPAALDWILAPDREDRASLDRWCSTVGPAVRVATPGLLADGIDSVALISWNAHVGGGDVVRLVRDLRTGQLTAGRPVAHFVLLLQEVHRAGSQVPNVGTEPVPRRIAASPPGAGRVDILQAADRLGLELYYVPSMANGRAQGVEPAEDRGNAILSSLPLDALTAIELPFEAQRRVAVAATFRGTTTTGVPWQLRVVSAHLDHRSRGPRFLASLGAGRLRQARALVAALEPGLPTILGGDLNTWSVEILEAAVPFLQQYFSEPARAPLEATYSTGWGFRRRLDHLMFRLPEGYAGRARTLEARYGSDHHPLLGWVRFEIRATSRTLHGPAGADTALGPEPLEKVANEAGDELSNALGPRTLAEPL